MSLLTNGAAEVYNLFSVFKESIAVNQMALQSHYHIEILFV